jgi:hypothetical protein
MNPAITQTVFIACARDALRIAAGDPDRVLRQWMNLG